MALNSMLLPLFVLLVAVDGRRTKAKILSVDPQQRDFLEDQWHNAMDDSGKGALVKEEHMKAMIKGMQGMPEGCSDNLHGFDKDGRCREDKFGNNFILDRFAKKECCEAFFAIEEARLVAMEEAKIAAIERERNQPALPEPGLAAESKVEEEQVKELRQVEEAIAEELNSEEAKQSARLAQGTVYVRNFKASNLPTANSTLHSSCDAFVKVSVTNPITQSDGTVKGSSQSPHIENNLNPVWDWSESFQVGASLTGNAKLIVELFDHDSWFSFWWDGHDFIHDEEIVYDRLAPDTWVTFQESFVKKDGTPQGELSFEVKWEPGEPDV